MTKITAGHTIVSKGTLNGPNYLVVEAGGGFKAANGATNNYEILIHGGAAAGAAGGYGGVLANATVTNGADGTVAVFGGGGYGSNPNGAGGSLVVNGTLVNMGLLEAQQLAYVGGPPQLSIAATGTLINESTLRLTGADGSKNVPLATIGGSTLAVAGVLLNGGTISVGGGKLALDYGGNGATLLIDGTGATSGLTNLGTIAIHGAYPGSSSPFTYAGAGGAVTVSAGRFTNDAQIFIDAATNTASLYGGAGGVLLTTGSAAVLNAGTITVAGQTTGAGLTAPAGTLSIGGQSFYDTGTIDVAGASVAGGAGGTLVASTSLVVEGVVYLQDGTNGGASGAASLGGVVYIGKDTPGTLTLGSYPGAPVIAPSLTISGELFLSQSSNINLYQSGQITVTKSGELFDTNGYIGGSGSYGVPGPGAMVNDGYIDALGTYSLLNAAVTNNGRVVVSGGELAVDMVPAGTGSFTIEAGGFLASVDGMSQGQTVQFASTPGLRETFQLYGGLVGATLAGINDTSVLYVFRSTVSDVTSSGTHLTFTDSNLFRGTYNVSLTLAAPLPAGTQLTVTPTARGDDIGFIFPGGVVPAAQGPGADHGLSRAMSADPAALFSGHLTA